MRKLLFAGIVAATILLSARQSEAEELKLDTSKSTAEFVAIGKPSALKIHGSGAKPEGIIHINGTEVTGEVKLNLNDFSTGISTRDEHMKTKYLESTKPENKEALLKITTLKLPVALSALKSESTTFGGMLRMHGHENPVSGDIKIKSNSATNFEGEAHFQIKLTDYGVEIPSYAGIHVAETVDVTAKLVADVQLAAEK